MATVDEAESQLGNAATLFAGLRALSLGESVTFVEHVRRVLPIDGYVFWLATQPMEVFGSLHVSSDKRQLEDETIAVNRCVFSTETEIQAFNAVGPNTLWIAEVAGIKFAFSQRGFFYKPSNLWHYSGDAVYPALSSQLLPVGQLSERDLIVSNSLPAWLRIEGYNPVWLQNPPNPGITAYPSFLVPANLPPPYASVHIDPPGTTAMQAVPWQSRLSSDYQLASDRVRVTLYGCTNDQASAWRDTVLQFSSDTHAIGMMDVGIIRDEKRTQAELGVIAEKKTIEFVVSYTQRALRRIARQLIKEADVTFITEGGV